MMPRPKYEPRPHYPHDYPISGTDEDDRVIPAEELAAWSRDIYANRAEVRLGRELVAAEFELRTAAGRLQIWTVHRKTGLPVTLDKEPDFLRPESIALDKLKPSQWAAERRALIRRHNAATVAVGDVVAAMRAIEELIVYRQAARKF